MAEIAHRMGMVICAIYVDIHTLPKTEAIPLVFAKISARMDGLHPEVHFCCHPIYGGGSRLEIRVAEGDPRPPERLTGEVFAEVDQVLREARPAPPPLGSV